MRLVSFDPLRTCGIPQALFIKPERYLHHLDQIREADWVLFPEYWQINAIHYGLTTRIFPSAASYHLGHTKVEMTRAFQLVAPEHVPETLILANTENNCDAVWERMVTPFVVKDIRNAQGAGVWLIEGRAAWRAYCAREETETLYVQEYLPIERDLRVVVIGNDVATAYWRLKGNDGFHTNVARGGRVCREDVPTEALALVRRVSRALGINHAGFDVAIVGEHCYLFEFNRLFGAQGVEGGDAFVSERIFEYLERETRRRNPPQGAPPEAAGRVRRSRRRAA